MKLKVGVVSSSRDDLQEIKKSYADLNLVQTDSEPCPRNPQRPGFQGKSPLSQD
ncbi:MAG: hypothetical protein ACK5RO_00160 [Pseudobdellovibrionaceae bacterium]